MADHDVIRLTVKASGAPPRHVSVEALPCVIGRDPGCDLVLDDPLASRRHAQIERDEAGRLRIRDLGSSNGTFADGSRLTSPLVLSPATAIRIGRTLVGLEATEPAGAATVVAVPPPIAPPIAPPAAPVVSPPIAGPAAPRVAPPVVPVVTPVAARVATPAVDGPSRSPRFNPIGLGVVVAAFAVVGIVAAIVLAGGGKPSSSTAPPVARGSEAAVGQSVAPAGSPAGSGASSSSDGSTGTVFNFEITIGSTDFTSKTTITPTVCKRGPSGPHSIVIDYSSAAGSSHFMLTIDDAMANPPVVSSADISLKFAGASRALIATGSDVTVSAVTDEGDHATITLAAKNSKGDRLSGAVTCSSFGS
jgi:pSer/pThr/pTyr-binding forkhead associated (FHA) protein